MVRPRILPAARRNLTTCPQTTTAPSLVRHIVYAKALTFITAAACEWVQTSANVGYPQRHPRLLGSSA